MSESLRVDPIACTGHGLCAELFPERIWLDEWGYPVIEDGELTPDLLEARQARRRRLPVGGAAARARAQGRGHAGAGRGLAASGPQAA